ncbi:MAG: RagB/SusD family nutrient uptake outer membrane protein [Bacteroidetes bacterium]|nr:MAG: RagB/SusD family nutrient uptake outer membrane protein [Bacteroidota bacterium]
MKKNINTIRISTILFAVFLLWATPACEVTDLQPATQFSEVTAFSSPQRVELAVIGMYNASQSGSYAGGAVRGYPFGAASFEQNEMRGEDLVNQALFFAITYESTYTPFSANNVWMWNTLFTLINQANIVIEGVQTAAAEGIITGEVAASYEGEARLMRALAYHELLINFSRPFADGNGSAQGLPIRDFAVNSPADVDAGIAEGRATVAETYAFILEDLDFAEENLVVTRTGAGRVSRATKGAAIALKTRVKLHKGDWAGVLTEADKLVPAAAPYTSPIGAYTLTAAPDGPFTNNQSSEAIFIMENVDTDNPGVNGALPAMLGNPAKGGRGLVVVGPAIYNFAPWTSTDKRRNLLSNDGKVYYTDKYKDITGRGDDAPIIRYAEVLLNAAEAAARLGNTTRGLDLLNAVRNRAVDAADQYTAASFADQKSLVQAILDERRIEFLAEGRRWPDIHRLALDADFTSNGIPAKTRFGDITFAQYDVVTRPAITRGLAAIPYADYRFLWPIPADELAQNPTLAAQQNPGY